MGGGVVSGMGAEIQFFLRQWSRVKKPRFWQNIIAKTTEVPYKLLTYIRSSGKLPYIEKYYI